MRTSRTTKRESLLQITPILERVRRNRVWIGNVILARSWVLLIATLIVIIARRWSQVGYTVSGVDGGQWLAFGRGLADQGGRSTAGAFPPLVPLLLHLGQKLSDPILAARILAVASLLVILAVSCIVAIQGMQVTFAAMVLAMVGLSSALTEPVAFGGYPQHVAFAFLLVAALATARFLVDGQVRPLAVASLALIGAALSHHMYFALACMVVGLVWGIWLTTRPARTISMKRTMWLMLAGLLALACFAPTFLGLRAAGYTPPINASTVDLRTALHYGIREAPWFWLLVTVVGSGFLVATYRRRSEPVWQVAASLLVTFLVLFPLTAEARLVPLLVVGASLGVGLAVHELWVRSRQTVWRALPVSLAIALPVVLWPAADSQATDYFNYYRVVDQSLINTAEFVDRVHGDGRVVVRQDRRGWPVGWWFEGLTGARIIVGSDQRWLGFPDERANARLADRFFDSRLTSAEAAVLAADNDVALLVFRKWEWIGWERWLAEPEPAVEVIYDDGEFLVISINSP